MLIPNIIFFGSFQHYSAEVLRGLHQSPVVNVLAVITTPPYQATKNQPAIKSNVHQVAERFNLPVFTPESLTTAELQKLAAWLQTQGKVADLCITAGYGKLVPNEWLAFAADGALNLHFSLLPKYRGANPAEWALLRSETHTGNTLIEMGPEFDTGKLIAQSFVTIDALDTRETLYEKLYDSGKNTLAEMVASYFSHRQEQLIAASTAEIKYFLPPQSQAASPTPFAKRLTRDDGFISWAGVQQAMAGEKIAAESFSAVLQTTLTGTELEFNSEFVERAVRALAGFPSLWTKVPTAKGGKRLKILAATLAADNRLILEKVQIEGQSVATWNQVKNIIQAS